MSKKVLYHGFEKTNRFYGWGDIINYGMACKLHYDSNNLDGDIYIVFPRFDYDKRHGQDLNINKETTILPWNFIPNNINPNFDEYDIVIDTTEKDSLYPGFGGIDYSGHTFGFYPSKYYNDYKISPYLDLGKPSKKYILFQWRDREGFGYFKKNKELRNSSAPVMKYYLNIFKRLYGDKYEMWKTGEESKIDNLFDRCISLQYDDLDKFIMTIYNSALYVGPSCGPLEYIKFFKHLPALVLDVIPEYEIYYKDYILDYINTNKDAFSTMNINIHPSWCYDKYILLNKGNRVDEKFISKKFDVWLKNG